MPKCLLYAGPSAVGVGCFTDPPPGLRILPPIKRGDVGSLVRSEAPGVMALADGIFHAHPTVGHREILDALRSGWIVYGLCSLGALRACEMAKFGMIPFGRVAQRYVDEPETPDDYVALLHGPGPDYLPLSEPYVHMEFFMAEARKAGLLSGTDIERLAAQLTQCWYGERTLGRFRALLLESASGRTNKEALLAMLADFDKYRIKNRDLEDFLTVRPWSPQVQSEGERGG